MARRMAQRKVEILGDVLLNLGKENDELKEKIATFEKNSTLGKKAALKNPTVHSDAPAMSKSIKSEIKTTKPRGGHHLQSSASTSTNKSEPAKPKKTSADKLPKRCLLCNQNQGSYDNLLQHMEEEHSHAILK